MKFTEKFRLPLYEAADRVLKEQFNEAARKVEAALEGKADSGHTHTAAQVGAVPAGRKVNGKPLSSDITLTAADVGAAAAGHTHTLASLGLDSLGQAVVGAVAGLKIASGRAHISSGEYVDISYSDAGFTASPNVVCSYCFDSYVNLALSLLSITYCNKNSCRINGKSSTDVAWIAIGV